LVFRIHSQGEEVVLEKTPKFPFLTQLASEYFGPFLLKPLKLHRQEGRAVLNGYEAKHVKLHLENNMKHDVSFALVLLDSLKRRDVMLVTRMFCKTIVGMLGIVWNHFM